MAERAEGKIPARREPFSELEPFFRFDPFRDPFFRGGPFRALTAPLSRWLEEVAPERWRGGAGAFLPAADITENDEQYVVSVELPGIQRDDVTVEVHERVLTIHGEKKSEREEKKEHRRWVERSYGTFTRSFTLPEDADADRIEASFKDGVLTLRLPKRPEAKPKTIAIKP